MRGIPGSGKSTSAKIYAAIYTPAVICSTDDYWYQEDPNLYKWDPTKVREAHQWNQIRVRNNLMCGSSVIVDNTNLDSFAVAPYFDMHVEFDVPILIAEIRTPIDQCIARQVNRPKDRQIPADVIETMARKFDVPLDIEAEKQKARIRYQLRNQN